MLLLFMVYTSRTRAPQPPGTSVSAANPATASDEELVRALATGDSGDALTHFYSRFSSMVMALLLRMLGSHAEAEELLQEIFVELWRRAPQYDRKRASVATWVVTITRSRALDALRARQRRGGDHHVSADDTVVEAPREMRPDAVTASNLRSAALHRALAQLSIEQRQALELSYFAGLSHGEIARELTIPVGTVKSRIISAMKVLRRALAPTHTGDLS